MMVFEILHPRTGEALEALGLIPEFLSNDNPAPAKEQLDKNYQHGGGWWPMEGFKMCPDHSLVYPGDPPYKPIAQAWLRDELIVIYPYSWVAIIQPDKSFEVARMD